MTCINFKGEFFMGASANEIYKLWLEKVKDDRDLICELDDISGKDEEIFDRFYTKLKFGTAGLRGVIGAGTNRMNIYTVRQATQGLANYLNNNCKKPKVAIAYDSRIKSELFAKECARVLAANGVKVFITKELQPAPVLSFAVRDLACDSGIMITASHNPAKYNGYKCYGSDGCQITDEMAASVYSEIQNVDMFTDVKLSDLSIELEKGNVEYISEELYDSYIENVKKQSIRPGCAKDAKLKVVYSPLNGAGNKLVRRVLNETGVYDIVTVREQEFPDGNFPSCPYPNPEIREAMELAIKLADEVKPDLVLATDPDSDRVGIAVENNGEYILISGNENGALMFDYICKGRIEQDTMPKNPMAVKTIVTTQLASEIAEEYGVELVNVLTGFKWIGDQILKLENKGEENRYLFGFEESYGYLAGTYVRDKDAVVASMLICEMAAYYKRTQGKNLYQVLMDLYEKYGFYKNKTLNFEFEGATGMQKMDNIMQNLRKAPMTSIANIEVLSISDYLSSQEVNLKTQELKDINLPKSNVLLFSLTNGSTVVVRPSGTEPKIKVYITAVGKTSDQANHLQDKIVESMSSMINMM